MQSRRYNGFVWSLHFVIGAFLGIVLSGWMWMVGRPRPFIPSNQDHWKTCISCPVGRCLNLFRMLGEPDIALFTIGLALVGAGIVCLYGDRLWFGGRNAALDLSPEHTRNSRSLSIGVGVLGVCVLAYAVIFT